MSAQNGRIRQAVLLRGINLGAVNKVPMGALRAALDAAGFGGEQGVRTYLQSGNIALESELDGAALQAAVEALVRERFGVSAPAVIRSPAQMRAAVDGNPFPEQAQAHPKRYQVSFLSQAISDRGRELLQARAAEGEAVAVSSSGMEVYAWHPDGVHVSRLASQITEKKLGVAAATARNWTTVVAVLDLLQSAQQR